MKDYAFVFLLIALIAGLNAAWVAFWALMGASSTVGAKLSKKVGLDNDSTDKNIELGKVFTGELIKKTVIRAGIALVAYIIYLIIN